VYRVGPKEGEVACLERMLIWFAKHLFVCVWMSVFVHPDIARMSLDGVLYKLVRVNKALIANYWQEIYGSGR
jgi:hypothetical protein